jgi:hypothetical protein
MIDAPFTHRLLLLAAVFVVLAMWHFRRAPTRWREYAFLFLAGGLGGAVGVVNDFVTSAISPFYFETAKGLGSGVGLVDVAALGFQAGFVAAAFAACALLYANNSRPDASPVAYSRLFRLMVPPVVAASVFGVILAAFSQAIEAYPLVRYLEPTVPREEARRFLMVAAIHYGLYLGLVVGLVVSIRRVRQLRGTHAGLPNPRLEPTPHQPLLATRGSSARR